MQVKIKRVYEEPGVDDVVRLLVERLWPRGLTKVRGIAPSPELRKWFNHDPV